MANESSVSKTESLEAQESARQKLELMLWGDDQAIVIGKFLEKGKVEESPKTRETLWGEVAEATDFTSDEAPFLLASVKDFLSEVEGKYPPAESRSGGENLEPDEYRETVVPREKTLTQVAVDCLRRFGVMGVDDSRRVKSHGGFRRKGRPSYSQAQQTGGNIVRKGYLPADEGGPQMLSGIFAPAHGDASSTSDSRQRRSMAHEVVHIVRALANRSLWEGFEPEVEVYGLDRAVEHTEGFKVGSNRQGSEAIGELFAVAVEYEAVTGKQPTIRQVLPELAGRLEQSASRLEKKMKGSQKFVTRYLAAKYALIHHLNQLSEIGYQDLAALDLVALGSYGYTSLEKAPALIQLGVMDEEKFGRMKKVVRNLNGWLNSTGEKGFKVS